jgi:hypothetical protein
MFIDGENDIAPTDVHFNDSVHFTDAGSARMAERVIEKLLADPKFQDLVN